MDVYKTFICVHRYAVYMDDKKRKVEYILDDLEEMMNEVKQYIDDMRVHLDDGKQWLEADQ